MQCNCPPSNLDSARRRTRKAWCYCRSLWGVDGCMARRILWVTSSTQGFSGISQELRRDHGGEHPTDIGGPLYSNTDDDNLRFFGKECQCGGSWSTRTFYHSVDLLLHSFNSPSFTTGDITVTSLSSSPRTPVRPGRLWYGIGCRCGNLGEYH